jgi:hypothetical protein
MALTHAWRASGVRSRLLPAPFPVTVLAGHPQLRSTRGAPLRTATHQSQGCIIRHTPYDHLNGISPPYEPQTINDIRNTVPVVWQRCASAHLLVHNRGSARCLLFRRIRMRIRMIEGQDGSHHKQRGRPHDHSCIGRRTRCRRHGANARESYPCPCGRLSALILVESNNNAPSPPISAQASTAGCPRRRPTPWASTSPRRPSPTRPAARGASIS